MEIKTYLVAICKKHTKEVIAWYDVPATDWKSAIYLIFDLHKEYNSTEHYGEAILV